MKLKGRIIAATPLICLIVFLSVGFLTDIWNPTWCVFFLIPIMPILLSEHLWKSVYPLVCIVVYVFIGLMWGMWHPGWIIFLTIPVYFILIGDTFRKKDNEKATKKGKVDIID